MGLRPEDTHRLFHRWSEGSCTQSPMPSRDSSMHSSTSWSFWKRRQSCYRSLPGSGHPLQSVSQPSWAARERHWSFLSIRNSSRVCCIWWQPRLSSWWRLQTSLRNTPSSLRLAHRTSWELPGIFSITLPLTSFVSYLILELEGLFLKSLDLHLDIGRTHHHFRIINLWKY